MSPFLYILVADSLSRRFNMMNIEGNLPGIGFVKGVQPINHAQFVDDTILLGGVSVISAKLFKSKLYFYQEASGSPINYNKSQILSWNCNPREMVDISRILGINGKIQWDDF